MAESSSTGARPAEQPAPDAANAERQRQEQMLHARMAEVGRKLLVLSGKGGVGKSTVAANLAVALARAGRRVGLLDADVHGPSIPQLLGLTDRPVGMAGGEMLPVQADENLSVMSLGLLLATRDEPVIWRGPRKFGAIRQLLADVAWGPLDYLLVDSPPGTGDEPLSVAQLVGSPAGAIIVTTPQDLAIADVRRCISFCRAVAVPVVGIIENMSGYVCPKCGHRVDLFKTGGGRRLADELHLPFLGQIPVEPGIVVAGDAGEPFAGDEAASPGAAAFAEIARRILDGEPSPDAAPTGASDPTDETQQESHPMKIAVPIASGRLSMHFGHCEQFAILEVDKAAGKVLGITMHNPPAHEPGALPRWLHEIGADVIIAGGMGQRAQGLFAQNGIDVVVGAPSETPEELAAAFLEGRLEVGDNICDH